MTHNESCVKRGGRYVRQECRDYSTDGTALGADIAHKMGTTDEEEIKASAFFENEPMTGMDEEQADWEADDEDDPQHGFDAHGVSGYEL